jgi:hypothetical protein
MRVALIAPPFIPVPPTEHEITRDDRVGRRISVLRVQSKRGTIGANRAVRLCL